MYSEIKHWVDTCESCAKRKGHRPDKDGELKPIITKEVFDIMRMDFFRLLPTTKNDNTLILSFTDLYSKWVELFAVKQGNE